MDKATTKIGRREGMKIAVRRLIREEKGQALVLVLILLVVGGLIIAPLLEFMGTGLKVGKDVYENKMYQTYAADAGVEDGLWEIKYNDLARFDDYDEYKYYDYNPNNQWPYSLNEPVNGYGVNVTIKNVWIPKDIPTPDDVTARMIIEQGKLIITGGPSLAGESTYEIKISYARDCTAEPLPNVNTIGIWLPPGFGYTEYSGSCSLQGESFYSAPTVSPYKGSYAVVWNFAAVPLSSFPGGNPDATTVVITFTFQYTGEGQSPNNAVSWINTSGADIGADTYTWDADVKIYQILSVAGDCEVEAYTAKIELRKLGSALSGDYVAIGNSLMLPDPNNGSNPQEDWRSQLLMESSATIQNGNPSGAGYIPAGATIEYACLYWSGFIDYHYLHKGWGGWGGGWSWVPNPYTEASWCDPNETRGVQELNYNNYSSNPSQLVENAKVNTVSFGGGVTQAQDIAADEQEVAWKCNDAPACWYYTCFKDVTNLELSDDVTVKQDIEDAIGSGGSGTYTFTLGHASHGDTSVLDELRPGYPGVPGGSANGDYYSFTLYDSNGNPTSDYTGYPLATPATKSPNEWSYGGRYHASYAGWSLIIIYSSPETKGHQLYLYDIRNPNFMFVESFPDSPYGSNPDFDGDGSPGGKISDFLVPDPVVGEQYAAHMTCFVGEGDYGKTGDSFKVTGPSGTGAYLLDGTGGPWNDVWNSNSVGMSAAGVDVDTFYVTWISNILETGDTWAQVDIPTSGDGFTLVYVILSFRSSTTSGGSISYLIRK
jgi:hypothetical protein